MYCKKHIKAGGCPNQIIKSYKCCAACDVIHEDCETYRCAIGIDNECEHKTLEHDKRLRIGDMAYITRVLASKAIYWDEDAIDSLNKIQIVVDRIPGFVNLSEDNMWFPDEVVNRFNFEGGKLVSTIDDYLNSDVKGEIPHLILMDRVGDAFIAKSIIVNEKGEIIASKLDENFYAITNVNTVLENFVETVVNGDEIKLTDKKIAEFLPLFNIALKYNFNLLANVKSAVKKREISQNIKNCHKNLLNLPKTLEILKKLDNIDVEVVDNGINVVYHDLELYFENDHCEEYIPIGTFTWSCSIGMDPVLVKHEGPTFAPYDAYITPHIGTDKICMGSFSVAIKNASAQLDIVNLVLLIREMCVTYNPEDSYITDFCKIVVGYDECVSCGKMFALDKDGLCMGCRNG
nr:MAG: hypothetical protein [Helarchaeota virus Nidhogg Meg22_1012]